MANEDVCYFNNFFDLIFIFCYGYVSSISIRHPFLEKDVRFYTVISMR